MYFQVAFYASGVNPESHDFVGLDISAPRSSSSSGGSTTSSVDKPECLRSNDDEDDVFEPYSPPTLKRTGAKEPPKKRPRNSSQDMFLNSSPESCSELQLTPFFGHETPAKAVLQITGINVNSDGVIGKRFLKFSTYIYSYFCVVLK